MYPNTFTKTKNHLSLQITRKKFKFGYAWRPTKRNALPPSSISRKKFKVGYDGDLADFIFSQSRKKQGRNKT